jgi:hypothetical protein
MTASGKELAALTGEDHPLAVKPPSPSLPMQSPPPVTPI